MGFSFWWPLSLESTGSGDTAHGLSSWGFRLQSAGSAVGAQRLSCFAACEIFPDTGSNLWPLHWHVDSYPQSHQGSSSNLVFFFFLSFFQIQIQEESDMWKIRELEKQMDDAYRGTKRKMLPSSSRWSCNSENQNILISFRIIYFCLKTWWCAKDRWIQFFCESFKTFLFHKSWLKHTGNGYDAYSPTVFTYLEWRT